MLERGYKFTQMGLNQKDVQFIESRGFAAAEVIGERYQGNGWTDR